MRSLVGFPMTTLIGHLFEPMAYLQIHVSQIGEGAQRPEALPQIAYRPFDFSFFPRRPHMAGSRQETVFAREGQKAGVETDQVAIVLGNGSRQIVIPKFTCDSAEVVKGVNVAAHESFEALAVSELHIQLAAMAFHETEGIELAGVALVGKDAEMAPVDFEALAGCGLHSHISPLGLSFRT